MDHARRIRELSLCLERRKLDALLVTHAPNVRYLCGFTGSSGVLIASERPVLITDGRYTEQARHEVKGARVITAKIPAMAAAAEMIRGKGQRRVGIESAHMSVASLSSLKALVGSVVTLVKTDNLVQRLRMVKDEDEVELVRGAVTLGSKLLKPTLKSLQPGIAEAAVAGKLEYAARVAGAEAMSFTTIVASGVRSAMPHGVASQRPVESRGFVVLDYGVILCGYCSDMTRTVYVGRASEQERAVYQAVLDAQLAAVAAVRPGVSAGEVDEAARSTLRRSRLAKFFTHSTGHGVGLEIHEAPRVAAKQEQVLQPGMVITIEPGVYMPGKYGVRIEDMVLVTERGHEVLTPSPKELIEL
jgi:Xaa-Pro aminopeptidase